MSASHLVFLRPRTRIVIKHFEPQTHLHWSPRLTLQTLASVRNNLQMLTSILTRQHQLAERIVQRPAEGEIRRREVMVLQLVQQGTRLENSGMPHVTASALMPPAPLFRPQMPSVPRLLVRQTPQLPEHTEPPAVHGLARSGTLMSSTPAQPLDVDRLTEHVIQTIDRRLQAYRERIGRR